MSFAVSSAVHGTILAWLAFSPQSGPAPRRLSIYEQEIKPHEKQIVWYHLRDRLPEVQAEDKARDPRPARAKQFYPQPVVAGKQDKPGSTQTIYMPAPEIELPGPLPLPNVLAVSRPVKQLRVFAPPPEKTAAPAPVPEAPEVARKEGQQTSPLDARPQRPLKQFSAPEMQRPAPKVNLAEAPDVASRNQAGGLPAELANARAPRKQFTPPPERPARTAQAPASLPVAPEVSGSTSARILPSAVPGARAPLRTFNAPGGPTRTASAAPAELPAAPEVSGTGPARNLPAAVPDSRAPLRRFNAPAGRAGGPGAAVAELPAAPEVAAAGTARSLPSAVPDARAPLRRFNAPPMPATTGRPAGGAAGTADVPSAPALANASGNAETTLAIVGLHPTSAPDFTPPPGSVSGGFSAGPKPNRNGSEGASSEAAIVVPWLTARGGSKEMEPTMVTGPDPKVKESLMAAARSPMRSPLPDSALPRATAATRVSNAPDPKLEGRAVYSIAIQMPNVTSYSGSWIVWFSERKPVPGAAPPEVRAPVPLRKVDPKYIAEAAQERVEGTVRLFAVIRSDGHVENVSLLRHLDARLDQSAQDALSKWVFEPALRNGSPMDVEAVFEIPFRLAPRSLR